MKARCRLLVDNPQPPVPKAQIGRLIELEQRNCKSDDVALFDLILEHAKVQQRFYRMSQVHAGMDDVEASKPERRPQKTHGANPGLPVTPSTTPTPSGNAAARTERQQTGAPPTDGGGTGPRIALLPPMLSVEKRCASIAKLKAGGVRSKAARCEDLELTTTAGLVVLRSVPCLVLAGDGDEFLLGHEVLKGLGIDVEQQFSQLANSPLLQDKVDEFPIGDAIPRPADTAEPTNPLDHCSILPSPMAYPKSTLKLTVVYYLFFQIFGAKELALIHRQMSNCFA
ncbi:hypothetical protein PHMEG_0007860 [Phytophthora megakarya]|uniref:Uncharacterized protein n=1 Tax=Phytophthora megakarya TaxID=4795 RepID=A0A225WKE0_9STRA|nr:hypothetical protein PHMEG_0007860 [Phytophthora megakarya]